jgi:hypothetical protein
MPEEDFIRRFSQTELNPKNFKNEPAGAEGKDTGKLWPIAG